ncbi:MAG: hypothetical protein KME18_02310 [Phormidium tanganyikae FI6-MK23]|jgi:hypothetical protein|nr:hypothetical protein [Phormidium tanganyikae FI6-MK23]
MLSKTLALLTIAIPLSSIGANSASAQITIRSTGVVSGTVVPPSQNPNFNQGTTRVNTDSQGRFFRNGQLVYSAQDFNPNLVQVDGSGRYFVDFRGIPIVSTDATLTSPVLSNGELQPIRRNHNALTRFNGTIQDELVVRGQYTGIATDPATGQQYQGTFDISGQGPRYSDRNGGTSPTVFDFRSHYNFSANPQIPPRPTVFSYRIDAMPVQLRVTIPAGLAPITQAPPTTPGSTPIPSPIAPPISSPIGVDSNLGGILSNNQLQQVSRVVLEGSKASPSQIGPSSRILLK